MDRTQMQFDDLQPMEQRRVAMEMALDRASVASLNCDLVRTATGLLEYMLGAPGATAKAAGRTRAGHKKG